MRGLFYSSFELCGRNFEFLHNKKLLLVFEKKIFQKTNKNLVLFLKFMGICFTIENLKDF